MQCATAKTLMLIIWGAASFTPTAKNKILQSAEFPMRFGACVYAVSPQCLRAVAADTDSL